MRYLDYGYAIFHEDIKASITWKQLSEYLVGVGRPELLNRYDSSEYPVEFEHEFGLDKVIVTGRHTDSSGDTEVFRTVIFGDFKYAEDGKMLTAHILREYSMDHEDGDLSGVVSDYGEGFFISNMFSVDAREAYGEFTNSENQEVHRFYNDEDELGRGRSAFLEDEVSKYFRDDWHLDPFGSNLVSAETDAKNLILQYKGNEYLLGTVFGTFSELKDVLVDDPWWHQIRIRPRGLQVPMNSSIWLLLMRVENGLMCK